MVSIFLYGFSDDSAGKESTCNAGDTGDVVSISGSGRYPGGGNGNPIQYSCLENSMDRGAWQAAVHEVTKSWMCLSNWAHTKKNLYITDITGPHPDSLYHTSPSIPWPLWCWLLPAHISSSPEVCPIQERVCFHFPSCLLVNVLIIWKYKSSGSLVLNEKTLVLYLRIQSSL